MQVDRRLHAVRPDLADESLRGSVEAARFTPGILRRIVEPSVPLRRSPSPEVSYDTEALMGEAIRVFEVDQEGWAWGQLGGDGYVGYLPAAALGDPHPEPRLKVGVPRTFLYPGPSLKLPVMGHLSLGAAVAVEAVEGDYARLCTGGYVFAGHLKPLEVQEQDFVTVAERFLHTPYLWGGKTSLGLDCSGLVQVSLAAAGIAAPRDSDMQEAGLGEPVAIGDDLAGLRRGDLLFWKGHVGIMLDEARLIHANGFHMMTAVEPVREARDRILAKSYGPVTSVRRLPSLGRG